MMSFDIAAAINKKLTEIPHLPCRIDEMTEREVEIFKSLSAVVGFLEFLKSEAEADPSPWRTGNPPEQGEYLVTFEKNNGTRDVMQAEWVEDWGNGFKWLDERSSIVASVLAWMPLPKPYQGRGDGSLVHR